MPEPGVPIVITILLAACVLLLLLLLLVALAVAGRLRRLEKRLAPAATVNDAGVRGKAADEPDASPGGAFDEFLREDPARRGLTKSEQFAAYRRWRQERGMNWSKP
jgi:hypothetical protein